MGLDATRFHERVAEITQENREKEAELWECHNHQDEDYIEILKENLELEDKLNQCHSDF